MTLAQRITLTAIALIAATFLSAQGFDGDRRIDHRYGALGTIVERGQRRRIGRHATQANEKIQCRRVQHQAKVIGHEAMAAQAVADQFGLEFLVAVFARAALGVIVVGGLGAIPSDSIDEAEGYVGATWNRARLGTMAVRSLLGGTAFVVVAKGGYDDLRAIGEGGRRLHIAQQFVVDWPR